MDKKSGGANEVFKESNGGDILDSKVKEGNGFYDGVQNVSNDPRQVVSSPGFSENFTR